MSDYDRVPSVSSEVEASVRTCLHSLQSQYPKAHERFTWLGLLPEEVTITPPMMAVWWQTEPSDAQQHLELFCKEGLLLAAAPMRIGDQESPGYRLHALFHDMARRMLYGKAENGLGLSAREAHRTLLERYQTRLSRSQRGQRSWSQLEEDGYIHDHLTWHMEWAEQFDDMLLLLKEETTDGKNAWFEAQHRLSKIANYREDVKRLWRRVQRDSQAAYERGEPLSTLGLELRHCLMLASVNSLAAKLPVQLIAELVQCGVWHPHTGLTYIRQIPEREQRSRALGAIAPHLNAKQLGEAVFIAWTIEDASERTEALMGIAKTWTVLGDPEQALSITRKMKDALGCALVLTEIATHLLQAEESSRLLAEALSVAQTIENTPARDQVLVGIAKALAVIGDAEQALSVTRTIERSSSQAQALREISPHLTTDHLGEAWSLARAIENRDHRGAALVGIARALAAGGDPEQALSIALTMERAAVCGEVLVEIAEFLNATQLNEALTRAQTLKSPPACAKALIEIGAFLPQADERTLVLEEALAIVRSIKRGSNRADILAWIACRLPQTEEPVRLLAEVLSVARTTENYRERAQALFGIANTLAARGDTEQALSIAQTIEGADYLAQTLTWIARHVTQPEERARVVAQALSLAWKIEDGSSRALTLMEIAPYLNATQLKKALSLARTIEEVYRRDQALAAIAFRLFALGDAEQALAIVRTMKYCSACVEAFSELVPYLNVAQLREAWSIARAIEEPDSRDRALLKIVEALNLLGEPTQALSIAQTIESSGWRDEALTGIAEALAKIGDTEQALALVRMIKGSSRADVLTGIAPHLSAVQLREAASLAQAIGDLSYQTLTEIAKALATIGDTEEALAIARTIKYPSAAVEAFIEIAHCLKQTEDQSQILSEALSLVQEKEMEHASSRTQALGQIAKALAEIGDIEQALTIVRTLEYAFARDEALAEIANARAALGDTEQALSLARTIAYDFLRAKTLTGIAVHLPQTEEQFQVLAEALSIMQPNADADYDRVRIKILAAWSAIGDTRQGLAVARTIENAYARAQAFIEIAGLLKHTEEQSTVLAEASLLAQRQTESAANAWVFTEIATAQAAIGDTEQALFLVHKIEKAEKRNEALVGIAKIRAVAGDTEQALSLVRMIENTFSGGGTYTFRAEALLAVTDHLTVAQLSEALSMASTLKGTYARGEALSRIAANLRRVPLEHFYALWTSLLQVSVLERREEVQSVLAQLPEVLLEKGGAQAMEDLLCALNDVARWWP